MFSIEGFRKALELKRLVVVNDFSALALALPYLAPTLVATGGVLIGGDMAPR